MDIDYTTKISAKDIMKKYDLSFKEYENIRRRTGERIKNARELYRWSEKDVPSVNQLIDYSLKRRKHDIGRFEVILKTPTSKSLSAKAQLGALKNYAGYGAFNKGFLTFSEGIPQFQIAYNNVELALKNETNMMKIPHFNVGEPISHNKNYYFVNNEKGRQVVAELNRIVDEYNTNLANTYPQNALGRYIDFVRKLMSQISFADRNDAIAGS